MLGLSGRHTQFMHFVYLESQPVQRSLIRDPRYPSKINGFIYRHQGSYACTFDMIQQTYNEWVVVAEANNSGICVQPTCLGKNRMMPLYVAGKYFKLVFVRRWLRTCAGKLIPQTGIGAFILKLHGVCPNRISGRPVLPVALKCLAAPTRHSFQFSRNYASALAPVPSLVNVPSDGQQFSIWISIISSMSPGMALNS